MERGFEFRVCAAEDIEQLIKDATFLFLFVRGELAGYLKVNENEAQTDLREARGLEIARKKQKEHIWLGVWERNGKAIAFYERMGFKKDRRPCFLHGSGAAGRLPNEERSRIDRLG